MPVEAEDATRIRSDRHATGENLLFAERKTTAYVVDRVVEYDEAVAQPLALVGELTCEE